MIVVDTNVWSETIRAQPASAVLEWVAAHAAKIHMPVVARHELRVGALLLPAGRRREELSNSIDQMLAAMSARLLTYDAAAADAHAEIRARAHAVGRALSAEDGQILGIAIAHAAAVATRNVRDFADYGVPVVDPWEWQGH